MTLRVYPALRVYVRQSLDRAGDEDAVTRQMEDCAAVAAGRGLTIAPEQVITDNDRSAARGKRRPGFEGLLSAIQAGDCDLVICQTMDRLLRADRRDQMRFFEAGQRAQVRLLLHRGSDVDMSHAAGRLVADILVSVARAEIEIKGERHARAQLQAAQRGERVGGRRPYGYEADGVTVRPAEAAAVVRGYAMLLSGVPLAGIARAWNAAGLPTPQRTHRTRETSWWTAHTVHKTLRNPRYAGLRQYRGEIMGPARWPALVAEETWRAAVSVLTDPVRATRPRSGRALLTGVARCGPCLPVETTVHGGRPAGGRYRTYRCRAVYGHISRAAEPAEDYVEGVIVERLARPDAYELLVDHRRPDVDALRGEARVLRARLDELAGAFAAGEITRRQLAIGTERARARLAEVEAELTDAGRVDLLGPLVRADDVAEAWEALDMERRRAVVDALAVVTLWPPGRGARAFRPETVEITWRDGVGRTPLHQDC